MVNYSETSNNIKRKIKNINKKMKKTMRMMLALMAGAMAFTACSNEDMLENIENNEVTENAPQLKPMTFTAVQEGQATTRTAIDGLSIKWTANDKISIFDGSNAYGGDQMFTVENGVGTISATFTGSAAEADTYYALYPYAVGSTSTTRMVTQAEAEAAAGSMSSMLSMWKMEIGMAFDDDEKDDIIEHEVKRNPNWNSISAENQAIIIAYLKDEPATIVNPGVELDGSSIKNVVIPAEQTVAAGQTVDPTAMIMVAKGEDENTLKFKNVCAYVKVTPQFDCTAICLTSKGTENLAGKIDINYNAGEPTTTVTANGTNTVYLVGTITAGNPYYIAVRPEALASGFTIEFLTADKGHYYARSTNNALALARNNVKNLGEFTTSGTWTKSIPTTGNDGAGHNWMLVSPTLKLQALTEFNAKVPYANIPSWAGWSVPTLDELTAVKAAFTVNSNWTKTTIKGVGILKYGNSIELEGNSNDYSSHWTSTAYDSDKQCTFGIINGNASTAKTNSMTYMLKYNN